MYHHDFELLILCQNELNIRENSYRIASATVKVILRINLELENLILIGFYLLQKIFKKKCVCSLMCKKHKKKKAVSMIKCHPSNRGSLAYGCPLSKRIYNTLSTHVVPFITGQKFFIRVACLWSKMPMLQRVGMREGGEPLPLAFQHLIFLLWWPCGLNLVLISSLASKCQHFKLRGL